LLAKGEGTGHDFHGNQWTGGSGGKDKAKVRNALATHKPSTKAKQDKATAAEKMVASIIGGSSTDDNKPVDITVGKRVGVEVKAMIDNGNNKVTMHPDALARKLEWGKKNGAALHTVVVDTRSEKLYHRDGVGSFRLRNMQQVTPKQLKALILKGAARKAFELVPLKDKATKGGDPETVGARASSIAQHHEPLTKGDRPGHEFHGNQYTGGVGGAAAEEEAAPAAPFNDMHLMQAREVLGQHLKNPNLSTTAAIREAAKQLPEVDARHFVEAAKHHGLNPSTVRIQVNAARGKVWEQGPPKPPEQQKPPEQKPPPPPEQKQSPPSPWMGRIASNQTPVTSVAQMKGVVTDEMNKMGMGTYRMRVSEKTYKQENGFDLVEKYLGAGITAGVFSPAGRGGKITLFAPQMLGKTQGGLEAVVRHEAQHARFNYMDASPAGHYKISDFIEKNGAALQKEDGLTSYSRAYWNKYAGSNDAVDFRHAVNESLSEMHAYYRPDAFQTQAPTYTKLNAMIEKAWTRSKYAKAAKA
jgi:hypothetical protein